jgi:hypothetical protein
MRRRLVGAVALAALVGATFVGSAAPALAHDGNDDPGGTGGSTGGPEY